MQIDKKRFRIDSSGESLAYFSTKKNIIISKKDIQKLIKLSLTRKTDLRICMHRSIKDMDYIVDKFIKYKVKSNSSIDYIILISSCIILTAWATYECLHLKNQKQSN